MNMRLLARIASGAVALVLSTAPALADRPSIVSGVVYDCTTHRPVPNAPVSLRLGSAESMHQTALVHTDVRGRYTIMNVHPGFAVISVPAGIVAPVHVTRAFHLDAGEMMDVPVGLGAGRSCNAASVPAAPQTQNVYTIR